MKETARSFIVCALTLCLAMLIFSGAKKNGGCADEVKAKRFVVYDRNGEVVWLVDSNGMRFINKGQRGLKGSVIALSNVQSPEISLWKDSSILGRRVSIRLDAKDGAPSISLFGEGEKLRGVFGSPRIDSRVEMGISDRGISSLVLLDEVGKVSSALP